MSDLHKSLIKNLTQHTKMTSIILELNNYIKQTYSFFLIVHQYLLHCNKLFVRFLVLSLKYFSVKKLENL